MTREFDLELTVRDREGGASVLETRFFFLPGDDADRWLREIVRWPVDQAGLALFFVGAKRDPHAPRGCLVRTGSPVAVPETRRAIPCEELPGGLVLPRPARLKLPVTRKDIDALAGGGHVFWHPMEGWVRFADEDAVPLEDLLEPPAVRPEPWNRAHPGLPPPPRLLAVQVRQTEEPDFLLEEGRDDIGSESDAGPPGAGGDSADGNWLRRAGQGIRRRFFEGVRGFTGRFPIHDGPRTWVNDLEDWASRNLERPGRPPQRDFGQLLDLLRTDPDEGLKYALPLGDHGAKGRGAAPDAGEGGGLARRNVDFDLGNLLGGGGRVGKWSLPSEDYAALHRAYRDSANRELNLGRYRRAAYILAHLLGDFAAAANALQQGHHHRDAAVLYRRKLNDPGRAAACYADGGLFEEAIQLYEELGNHEELGRLYGELGREDAAREAWERAVQARNDRSEFLRAGVLVERELGDLERARELFQAGWPQSADAAACLRAELRLAIRENDFERLASRIEEIRTTRRFEQSRVAAVGILGEVAASWPDPAMVPRIRDLAKGVAAGLLSTAGPPSSKRLLQLLPSLEPDDELFRRDARRHGRRMDARGALAEPDASGGKHGGLEKVAEKRLPGDLEVKDAAQRHADLVVVGRSDLGVALWHWGATGLTQRIQWARDETGATGQRLRVCACESAFEGDEGGFVILGDRPLESRALRREEEAALWVGTGSWYGETLGFAVDDHGGNLQLALVEGALTLNRYRGCRLVRSNPLEILPPVRSDDDVCLCMGMLPLLAQRDQVFFGLGSYLVRWFQDESEWMEFPGRVRCLRATRPHSRLRLVVRYEGGQALVWGDREWGRRETFGRDLDEPVCGFTASGHLVAADANRIAAYALSTGRVVRRGAVDAPGAQPVAVLPGARSDLVRLVRSGRLEDFRVVGR